MQSYNELSKTVMALAFSPTMLISLLPDHMNPHFKVLFFMGDLGAAEAKAHLHAPDRGWSCQAASCAGMARGTIPHVHS